MARRRSRGDAVSRPHESGSIYDGFSPAGQRALAQLCAEFRAAGFYAEKERRTERTLRVYPERRAKYPLLNPEITAPRHRSSIAVTVPSIVVGIYSDGDGMISRMLTALPSLEGCAFTSGRARRIGRYVCHGHLTIALPFVGSARSGNINFAALRSTFEVLHLHLSSSGYGP